MTVGIYEDRDAISSGLTADAGDIRGGLNGFVADANCIRLASNTGHVDADVDVVKAIS